MSVAKWNSIGQNQRVKITTVDPISRKVEATTKDSSIIQIAVWGQPTVFRWPKVGEIWIVARMGGYWMLVEPVQKDVEEAAPLEGFNSGDVNVTTGEGGRFLINGQPLSDGGVFAARRNHAAPNHLYQDLSTPTTWWLPLDSANGVYDLDTAESAGWTTVDHLGLGRPTLLVPPDAGAYSIGAAMQVGYVSGMTNGDLAQHMLFVVGKDGGGAWVNTLLFENKSEVHADATIASTSGFAPVVTPVGGTNTPEIGFAWGISTALFSVQPSIVFTFGSPPMIWAYKVA